MTNTKAQETLDIDLSSLLKKYTFVWPRNDGGRRHRGYKCNSCNELVLKLRQGQAQIYPGDTHCVEEIKVLLAHHEEKHGTKACEICGEFMTLKGMTRHQRSPDCVAQSRKHTMQKNGYELVDLSQLDFALNTLKEQLEKHVDWADPNGFAFIDNEAHAARYKFIQGLGVIVAASKRGPTYSGPDGRQTKNKGLSWLREEWAPWEVCHYINLINRAVVDGLLTPNDYLTELSRFADANEDQRGAMIGGMELSLET